MPPAAASKTSATRCSAAGHLRRAPSLPPAELSNLPLPISIQASRQTLSSNTTHMFDQMPDRPSRIRWCSRNPQPHEALALFREISFNHHRHIGPVLASALHCCAALGAVQSGKELHAFMVRNGYVATCRFATALVGFYAKSGFLSKARLVFDAMSERDVTAWTVMLMAYADADGCEDGMMGLLQEMLWSCVEPNAHTFTVVLRCVTPDLGEQLHARIVKSCCAYGAFVGSSLVDFYARNGDLGCARLVFDRVADKDVVCFNSLISGYGRTGNAEGFVSVFKELGYAGLAPDHSTMVGLLNGCANAGILILSRQLHAHAIVRGFQSEESIQGIIVDMYGKCGDLMASCVAFDRMRTSKGTVAWNSMIGVYAKHGMTREALQLFYSMVSALVLPDHITFTCLLSVCSHTGSVDEGWMLFDSMENIFGITPRDEHYCCLVDLLGRVGMVREAYEFICGCECEFGASVWGALLGACRVWGEAGIGELAAMRLFELEPNCSGSYVALANMFATNKRWSDANSIRRLMDSREIRKDPGYSWIEIGGVVHNFRSGEGMLNPFMAEVLDLCTRLKSCMSSPRMSYGSEDD